MQLYDTNLSWRLCGKLFGVFFQFDWWYDRGSRRRFWMPMEFRYFSLTNG